MDHFAQDQIDLRRRISVLRRPPSQRRGNRFVLAVLSLTVVFLRRFGYWPPPEAAAEQPENLSQS